MEITSSKRRLRKTIAVFAAMAAVVATPAVAAPIYLDFEGIAPYSANSGISIGGFYNGGTASNGSSGANLGVEFTSEALTACMNTVGAQCSNTSRGGLGIASSAFTALFFPAGSPTMNVAAGFDQGFSFVYSSPFAVSTSVSIFSETDGAGSMLASVNLTGTPNGACPTTISGGKPYCPFVDYSIPFAGVARSVVFGGTANAQVFDDFTFGSTSVGGAVPEPATWAMMIVGFGAVGGALRRRRSTRRLSIA